MKTKNKKQPLTNEQIKEQQKLKTAQQWIPIADINKNFIYKKDNRIIGMLRVQPDNLTLLSDKEKSRKVESIAEGFNGETETIQIFCVGRPVDLNSYLGWLQDKARQEQNFVKKMLLKGYIEQASRAASSGDITERRFYIIINKENSNTAEAELINRLQELSSKLFQADLLSNVCNEDELLDVLSLFVNPIQSAYEKVELQYDMPPVLSE